MLLCYPDYSKKCCLPSACKFLIIVNAGVMMLSGPIKSVSISHIFNPGIPIEWQPKPFSVHFYLMTTDKGAKLFEWKAYHKQHLVLLCGWINSRWIGYTDAFLCFSAVRPSGRSSPSQIPLRRIWVSTLWRWEMTQISRPATTSPQTVNWDA